MILDLIYWPWFRATCAKRGPNKSVVFITSEASFLKTSTVTFSILVVRSGPGGPHKRTCIEQNGINANTQT